MRITLYSRPGCHLCEEMKAVVRRVSRSLMLELEEVDISADPALESQFGLEIPVLLVEGRRIAKYRVSEQEIRRAVGARKGGAT
jgi:hypothetical protein